jgi:phosphate transport system substrate-binding protein
MHDTLGGGGGSPPEHYTTPQAYLRLFAGEADIIFVTYPSEDELAEAQFHDIEMEIIPVVKDAFVFLVNAENPVDGVALEQARAIYTGEITNWKTLGGFDSAILAYQRPRNSGSQTLLTKLVMDGREPMSPTVEWTPQSMGGLVDLVTSYDNARDAIGYSVFYYVNNMYGDSRFKLLAVDGVAPTRETIARGEYPLEDYYYAVMRRDTPEDSPARKLTAWLLTDEGQTVAARAGYIPMRPLEGVLPDDTLDPIYLGDTDNSSGTGGTAPKPADAIDEFISGGVKMPLSDLFYDGFNYIRYINDEIISHINSPKSGDWNEMGSGAPPRLENAKRPFTGVPNDYPHYEIMEYGDGSHGIYIVLPEGNPFFTYASYIRVRLTPDISPYGTPPRDDAFSVIYHYDRLLTPDIKLYTMEIEMPRSPELAARINEQLRQWTDGFPGDGAEARLLESFVGWCKRQGVFEAEYPLQPIYGQWGNYLSVFYPLQTYDGPWNEPAIYTISFDMRTGETVNLAERLPRELPYSTSMIVDSITSFDVEGFPAQENHQDYIPAEGSVFTSAWLDEAHLYVNITEPDGRKLQACFYELREVQFN